ncbi:Tripartite ATP-independent periplasmic transporters, DctQ component [Marinomonas aquimarina]|uniref:TRAP transporter small permease protein n=2 Tax=Marinomonas aquimarina TaxID=295068 RepID=A0A1A8TF23_9GAMM|nr:TRAP transporter small permease [Marinomonas aquimarina]SBS30461.1 Tripartite ATP-independent periplasmic transporters, DctQ component [Marinomonas aquimarina]
MFTFFSNIDKRVGWLLEAAAFVSSLLVVGLMLFLVLARYVFGWSVVGLLELIMLFGMWLYMLGGLIASRRNEHLVVDFVELKITDERMKLMHKALISLITFAICVFFIVLSYRMLAWGMRRPQSSPGMGIPIWMPQASIMLAAIGCTCYALRDFICSVVNVRRLSKEGQ